MGLATLTLRPGLAAGPAALLLIAAPGLAEPADTRLPDPVRAMIDAAIETGDPAKVAAVIEAARAVSPGAREDIDAMEQRFAERRHALAEIEAAEERQAIRHASLFDRWEGRGEIGAFQSTGNSENVGVTVALRLERVGIDWHHRLRASLDYQETDEVATREQYFVSYEPRFQINPRLFAYALAQWDKDEFQGFDSRYAVSGGLGYQLFDGERLKLSVKAGPAWRRTVLTDGTAESRLAALAGVDFGWQITDALKLTQTSDLVAEGGGTATAFVDANNTTINLVTALEASIIASLTARLAYTYEYDSNPAPGAKSTDTLSRLTLVYDF